MAWTLEFDGVPPGPNHRLHWARKAALNKTWRTVAYLKAQEQRIPLQAGVRLSAVIYRTRLGVADEDNDRARLKALVDGIADAGVVAKDTRKHVAWGAVTEERGQPRVVLTIEPLEVLQ